MGVKIKPGPGYVPNTLTENHGSASSNFLACSVTSELQESTYCSSSEVGKPSLGGRDRIFSQL
jgi:hypothetical protein